MLVIFHLNEMERSNHCYSNINNLLKESEVEEIRVLINGEPVKVTVKHFDQRLKDLVDSGVYITVCQNALDSNHINKEGLEDGVIVVPSGVFELMKRQEQEYSYIKV